METTGSTNETDRPGGTGARADRVRSRHLTRRAFLGSGAVAGTGAALTAPLLPTKSQTGHAAHSAAAHMLGTVRSMRGVFIVE